MSAASIWLQYEAKCIGGEKKQLQTYFLMMFSPLFAPEKEIKRQCFFHNSSCIFFSRLSLSFFFHFPKGQTIQQATKWSQYQEQVTKIPSNPPSLLTSTAQRRRNVLVNMRPNIRTNRILQPSFTFYVILFIYF